MRDCPGKSHHLATHHSAGHFPLLFAAFNSFGARNELHQLQPVCNVSWQTDRDRDRDRGLGTADTGQRTADVDHTHNWLLWRGTNALFRSLSGSGKCVCFSLKRDQNLVPLPPLENGQSSAFGEERTLRNVPVLLRSATLSFELGPASGHWDRARTLSKHIFHNSSCGAAIESHVFNRGPNGLTDSPTGDNKWPRGQLIKCIANESLFSPFQLSSFWWPVPRPATPSSKSSGPRRTTCRSWKEPRP